MEDYVLSKKEIKNKGLPMTIMPITPIHMNHIVTKRQCESSGSMNFIPAYDDKFININFAKECGVSRYGSEYWIWFSVDGNSRYYAIPFDSKEEATEFMIKIINCKMDSYV